MNNSKKYNRLEAVIKSELNEHKPDFERLFYLRSVQNQTLKKCSLLSINREPSPPPPKNVYYLQVSDVENIARNKKTVSFIRVQANENPFINASNLSVYYCEVGANGEFSTKPEILIIWGGCYLQICFIDIEVKQGQKRLYTLQKSA